MRVFYESAANRFWTDRTYQLESIPMASCVEMTEQEYAEFMASCEAAGGNPGPGADGRPMVVVPDWRPAAMSELLARRDRLLDVVSGMQSDYLSKEDKVNAVLCVDVKVALKDIATDPLIVAVINDPAGTRQQFNTAALACMRAIGQPASQAVKDEFRRYFTTPA